jgi:flavin reductase (DIM6/NTAB) family NADH-FMN oxidoreductase RutF
MIIDPHEVPRGRLYRVLIEVIVPRPIAFISTRSREGRTNLAPFSFFNGVSSQPPVVSVAINARQGSPKDTLRNIRETGEFVVNVVTQALFERMVRTSGDWPPETSEFELTGLTPGPSQRVQAPSVVESPVQIECRLYREVEVGDTSLVLGEVQCLRVDDALLTDGRVDPEKLRPIGRLGGDGYTELGRVLHLARPKVEPRERGPGSSGSVGPARPTGA